MHPHQGFIIELSRSDNQEISAAGSRAEVL